MRLTSITPGDSLGARRGEAVICIPVYAAHEQFVVCLQSVLAHTDADVRILVCDDASPDGRSQDYVEALSRDSTHEHAVFYLRQERNRGFPANVNCAFAVAAPADVVIVNSDCVVGAGWLSGLRQAAASDSVVATASTLTNHGSIVSVPQRGVPGPLPQNWTIDRAAAAVRAGSLGLTPRLPTAVGHCVYIRRAALDLVGDFDESFSPGYGEEVDFSQRCLQAGLSHVLADSVFVLHHGASSFSSEDRLSAVQEEHETVIAKRYSYYHAAVYEAEGDFSSPLWRALGAARRALTGLTVTIDARVLAGATTGTQLHVVELVGALARSGEARLTLLMPDRPSEFAKAALAGLENVSTLSRRQVQAGALIRSDVVHRPFQINHDDDLDVLAKLGDRIVITHQDLIGYHNPAYFRTFEDWSGYRRTTRLACASADRVVFFSDHARRDALAEDLLEASRGTVIHIGVDHVLSGVGRPVPRAPLGHEEIPPQAQTIVCLGTDFRHKNRTFALRVLERMRLDHGWAGRLVLVGPRVSEGSSQAAEAELLARHPQLADGVVTLGAVSEAEKAWLYERADLVLYPTVQEGFGLVPFEAADHGVPCLWAPGTSLSEVLPPKAGGIVAWDAAATAARAIELLSDERAKAKQLAAVRKAAAPLRWESTAQRLIELYRATCSEPGSPGSRLRRHDETTLTQDGLALVGPGGALPTEFERPLLALAMHPQIGTPMFRALQLGYRASRRWLERTPGGVRPASARSGEAGRPPRRPSGRRAR